MNGIGVSARKFGKSSGIGSPTAGWYGLRSRKKRVNE